MFFRSCEFVASNSNSLAEGINRTCSSLHGRLQGAVRWGSLTLRWGPTCKTAVTMFFVGVGELLVFAESSPRKVSTETSSHLKDKVVQLFSSYVQACE